MEIRLLRSADDRSSFQCGDESLDRFLRHYAGQNQFRHHIGVTYVAVEDTRILGYVTVAPRHLEIEDLPQKVRRKLPRYPIPVLGLARLAVDETARSVGLGARLLRVVLELAMSMSRELGCAGVVVDAKPGAESFYAKYGFTPFEMIEGESDSRPHPLPMWLSIQAIEAVVERPE